MSRSHRVRHKDGFCCGALRVAALSLRLVRKPLRAALDLSSGPSSPSSCCRGALLCWQLFAAITIQRKAPLLPRPDFRVVVGPVRLERPAGRPFKLRPLIISLSARPFGCCSRLSQHACKPGSAAMVVLTKASMISAFEFITNGPC